MMQPVTRNSITDYNRIVVDWVPLAVGSEDGNSEIVGYSVQYKLIGDDWIDLVLPESEYILTTTTAVDNLIKGEEYGFQIRARNVYGFGPFSTTTVIKASTMPSPAGIA
jgi:hypothetical protein